MKNFSVLKKRDGQNFKEAGTIFAADLDAAKKEFSENCRKDLEKNDSAIYLRNEEEGKKAGIDFEGAGYYSTSAGMWSLPLLDSDVIDSYNEDVYTWKVEEVAEEVEETEED